ncbi:MAG: DUF411 domain-containing protein [Bosea sp.]|uniref:DUF411 domain-containing protein n=1 Tax=Bosea sp. (in: a-proteobacteria) TaxID=1871050 RepID=UPI0023A31C23|nr:DUF411 domain-containing protein [Bosea sp. (in: a-proteobacteria)]MCP4738572.1 DUF411 domain-containing protein [Bosea sp. (in: a-proteobacteria)]
MQIDISPTRRALMLGTAQAFTAIVLAGPLAATETLPRMTVTRDPSCGCCGNWVEHIKSAGFPVDVIQVDDVLPLKTRLGVPEALMSCHTAEIGGYVIEGHVPAEAVKRLLIERPKAIGIAVPGMPVGSPGMEVSGQTPQPYEIAIFSAGKQHVFARYRGLQQV